MADKLTHKRRDGTPCTLLKLVLCEPEWAVARINQLERELAIAENFHKVAVAERDYERELNAELTLLERDRGRV